MKNLTETQVQKFREDGFVYPVDAMSSNEIARIREAYEASERMQGHEFGKGHNFKPHLLYKWADDLVYNENLLDAVEDLIGPNFLLLSTACFPKNPGQGSFVAWHQDGTYFGLDPAEQVTAWFAISDAPVEAGCMEVMVGSHKSGQLPHVEAAEEANMLSLGQTIDRQYQKQNARTEYMPLRAGQVSIHDTYAIHRSGPNHTPYRRLGISMNFIPTHVRPVMETKPTASLVRGVDEYQHFVPERRPMIDGGEAERVMHQMADRLFRQGHLEQREKHSKLTP